MAHRTSSAALHAARLVLKHFNLEVRPPETLRSGAIPNLTSSEAHVSILIDMVTNAFEVALVRPELRYWQQRIGSGTATAPQIGMFVRRLIDAVEKVPKDLPEHADTAPVQFHDLPADAPRPSWKMVPLSRFAADAVRSIFYYYVVTPSSARMLHADDLMLRIEMTKVIDSALGLQKAVRSLSILHGMEQKLRGGQASELDVKRCLRAVGILLEALPNYEEREDEVKLLV